jgi:hypothetical protein
VFLGYRAARTRHAAARLEAYDAARDDAVAEGGLDARLHLADIDDRALHAWHRTWSGRQHPSGSGGWNWPALLVRMPRRAAVLPIAIWHGDDLCGLALGYASRHRATGVRHTVTLTHVERRPEPPGVALRGHIVPLAVAAASGYGVAVGASRLCLRYPDPGLVGYYSLLGFEVAWDEGRPVYCEREI